MTRLYSVFEPPAAVAADPVTIKDGFTWLAILFPPLWLAWHGLWSELGVGAIILVLASVIGGLAGRPDLVGWTWFGLALLAAFEGPGWRRAALLRRGWREQPLPA